MARAAACVPLLLFLLAGVALIDHSDAATPTPAASPPAADCSSAITSLVDCLSYVQEGGMASKPEASCCSNLKKVVKTEASCLCEGFQNAASFGISLNMTKALALPAACGISTPPFSKCKVSGAASPAPSPASLFFKGAPGSSPVGTSGISGVPAPAPVKATSAASFQATVVGPVLIVAASIVLVAIA